VQGRSTHHNNSLIDEDGHRYAPPVNLHPSRPVRPIAWPWLLAVAGGVAAVLAVFAGRYGYHRDELYYLVAGRHLAWGYDDQPPLIPALARGIDELWDNPLIPLRLISALVVAVNVLLVGLIARELGGGRGGQVLAAACWATAPFVMGAGHLMSTSPFDVLVWTLLGYLLIRWIRTRDDRLLLALGPVLGVGMLIKNLPILYAVALLAGVLLAGPREVFRRPQLWVAAAIALAIWAPNLWWQASNGWPQLEMTAAIREDAGYGGRLGLVPSQLLLMGPPLAPIWIVGLWRLLRSADLRPYRALGWAYLVTLLLVLVTGGQAYYPAGAYPALFAAGAVAAAAWVRRAGEAGRRRRLALVGAAVALTGVGTLALSLPVYPVSALADSPQPAVNDENGETVGWPELAGAVGEVYDALPAAERDRAVILTGNYGEAGAIDRYGGRLGLPAPYSGHNAYWRWGPPPEGADGPVIVVGWWSEAELTPYCGSVTRVATVDNGYGVENEEQGAPIRVCRNRTDSWAAIWPRLRHLS
jgi:4-amino-4-deoxy-L-arabinose transferase-like glycosyltransferase